MKALSKSALFAIVALTGTAFALAASAGHFASCNGASCGKDKSSTTDAAGICQKEIRATPKVAENQKHTFKEASDRAASCGPCTAANPKSNIESCSGESCQIESSLACESCTSDVLNSESAKAKVAVAKLAPRCKEDCEGCAGQCDLKTTPQQCAGQCKNAAPANPTSAKTKTKQSQCPTCEEEECTECEEQCEACASEKHPPATKETPVKAAAMKRPAMHSGNSRHDQDHQDFFYLIEHASEINRKVKNLPNGIETLTESNNPAVAGKIQEHVESMYDRIENKNPIRMRDPIFRAIFSNADKIKMEVEATENGVLVRETSEDLKVVKLLQEHAKVVDLFIKNGYSELPKNHSVPRE